jgi:fatty acid desaturase
MTLGNSMTGFEQAARDVERPRPLEWSAFVIRKAVPKDVIGRLTLPSPWRAALAIGSVLAAIAGLIAGALWLQTWWAVAIAIVFIAGRQHAMLVLMHEAAHGLLHPNARINNVVSNLLLSFPLFISTELYRQHHLQHHRHVNTENDPDLKDTEIPPNGVLFILGLIGDLLGLRSLRLMASVNDFGVIGLFRAENGASRDIVFNRLLFLGFAAVVVFVLTLTESWLAFLLFWIVPMWFVLPPILHLRAVAEHAGRTDAGYEAHARTVTPMPMERALFCPMNINLHLEHHIFPDIPCYRLPEVLLLLDKVPDLSTSLRRNRGYLIGPDSVLAELYSGRGSSA